MTEKAYNIKGIFMCVRNKNANQVRSFSEKKFAENRVHVIRYWPITFYVPCFYLIEEDVGTFTFDIFMFICISCPHLLRHNI